MKHSYGRTILIYVVAFFIPFSIGAFLSGILVSRYNKPEVIECPKEEPRKFICDCSGSPPPTVQEETPSDRFFDPGEIE